MEASVQREGFLLELKVLVRFGVQKNNHDDVPADDKRVEKVDHPNQSSYSQRDRDCNQFAKKHTTHPSEANGKVRDQRVDLKGSSMEGR